MYKSIMLTQYFWKVTFVGNFSLIIFGGPLLCLSFVNPIALNLLFQVVHSMFKQQPIVPAVGIFTA